MDALRNTLSAVVEKTTFYLERAEIDHEGTSKPPSSQRVSAAQLREVYLSEKDRGVKLNVKNDVPDASMMQLVDALRRALGQFIHPDTDKIGHAFPVDDWDYAKGTIRRDGLHDEEFLSPVKNFTSMLLRAAAMMGVEKVVGLLADWERGEPVQMLMCTVLNDMPLSTSVFPQKDVQIFPLALTTKELPRLPMRRDVTLRDYLGLSLLKVRLIASPALFRPDPNVKEEEERVVRSSTVDGVHLNLDCVCKALSLQANVDVSHNFVWCEYPDTEAFYLSEPSTWGPKGNGRVRPRKPESVSRDLHTGEVTLQPSRDDPPKFLDEKDLGRVIEALRRSDKTLHIAVERWKRSKMYWASLEDQYIDLRIALEALYLKDFGGGYSQEMRFRLSLFGAWHLAENFEQRRSVRKTLRDAYDTASKAVHGGEVVPAEQQHAARAFRSAVKLLTQAQNLCRCGILKLLREGPPKDWGNLILGEAHNEL